MAKDSQIDKKDVRKEKSDGSDITIATENQQKNRNSKRQSIKNKTK